MGGEDEMECQDKGDFSEAGHINLSNNEYPRSLSPSWVILSRLLPAPSLLIIVELRMWRRQVYESRMPRKDLLLRHEAYSSTNPDLSLAFSESEAKV